MNRDEAAHRMIGCPGLVMKDGEGGAVWRYRRGAFEWYNGFVGDWRTAGLPPSDGWQGYPDRSGPLPPEPEWEDWLAERDCAGNLCFVRPDGFHRYASEELMRRRRFFGFYFEGDPNPHNYWLGWQSPDGRVHSHGDDTGEWKLVHASFARLKKK